MTLLSRCRSVENFKKIHKIEEGTYGVVFKAQDLQTGETVALKMLKLENENEGFPVTSLREIYTLLLCRHENIVNVKEIVVGGDSKSVFIVMDYVEHDLKSLLDQMKNPFSVAECKTLIRQLLLAVNTMHKEWIVHRDLKTSNLLVSNQGILKVADFGLARRFGSPLGPMTPVVVTLWYRAPELLLGDKTYSTPVDIWSVGCIFAELLTKQPLFPGKTELDQLSKVISLLGSPTEKNWPGFGELQHAKTVNICQPFNYLRSKFTILSDQGVDLLGRMLALCPSKRITAEEALLHPWLSELPPPKDPAHFPSWPSKKK